MPKVDGPTFNYGQYNSVLCALITALPKALKGIDPIELLRRIQNRGVLVEAALHEMLESVGAEDRPQRRRQLVPHVTPPSTMRIEVNKAPALFDGFELEEVGSFPETPRTLKVGLGNILDDTESQCDGLQVIPRSEELGPRLGETCAQALYRERASIHKSWDRYTIVFPGTTWLNLKKIPGYLILYKRNGEWILTWRSLKQPFVRNDRILCVAV